MANPKPSDVARWMLEKIDADNPLYQYIAAADIREQFGNEFVHTNDNGNDAIAPSVLKAFRQLSAETVVWERTERCWRLRQAGDAPGRQQDY